MSAEQLRNGRLSIQVKAPDWTVPGDSTDLEITLTTLGVLSGRHVQCIEVLVVEPEATKERRIIKDTRAMSWLATVVEFTDPVSF